MFKCTMALSKFGLKLNPYRWLREAMGVKEVRQSVVITNNPSMIDQNQQLLVRFPNLGAHNVIVPGTARLAFRITLDSEDANRTVVQNLGRIIVKKTVIKISGNEVMSVDDSDVFNCYGDLWKTASERKNDQYQGIEDLREQTCWVCLFHCKDRDSFEDCLRENKVIPTREQRALVRQQLAERKHAKLLLKTDQPAAYIVV